MFKIATTNYITGASVSAGNTNPSFSADNVKEPTLTRWQSSSTIDTLTITFAIQAVDLIALGNCRFSTLTVTGKLGGVTVFTENPTDADLDGVDVLNIALDSSGTIDELVLAFNGGSNVPYLGYIHIGDSIDFKIENYQPFTESTSQADTTIGGVIETNPGYAFRTFNVTVSKTDYTYAQIVSLMRPVMREYSYPRFYVFDDDCTLDEVVLGVLDSNRIGYDIIPIKPNGKYTAQFTIGISEVFAGEIR